MAALKTKVGEENVHDLLNKVLPETKRQDCFKLLEMFIAATGVQPKVWGGSTVGFGNFQYQRKSGESFEWFMIGFSPRKQNISLHIMPGFNQHELLMSKLGKYKTGCGCLYVNKLSDINLDLLQQLLHLSFEEMKRKYVHSI